MRLQRTRNTAVMLATLAAVAAPCLAQPAAGDAGELTGDDPDAIRDYIIHWRDRMAQAGTAKDVIAARDKLLSGYTAETGESFRSDYARIAGEELMKLVAAPRKTLTRLREVSASLVLATLRHTAAADAYRAMLLHPSQAVRYYGWQGAAWVAIDLLADESDAGKDFLGDVRRAAAAEPAPLVAEQMFTALASPRAPRGKVSDSAEAAARKTLLTVLDDVWLPWCRRVLDGRVDAAEACRLAATRLRNALVRFEGDAHSESRAAIFQMLADLLWASSKAYQQAAGDGQAAEPLAHLLLDLEDVLNASVDKERALIHDPMDNRTLNPDDRGIEVRLGALEWVNEHLAPLGVANPKDRVPPAEPAPGPPEAPDTES